MRLALGVAREGKQRDRACPLEGDGQPALVPGAGACDAPRQNLTALGDEPAEPGHLFVIDVVHLLDTKATDLAVRPLAFAVSPLNCHSNLLERDLVGIDVPDALLRDRRQGLHVVALRAAARASRP